MVHRCSSHSVFESRRSSKGVCWLIKCSDIHRMFCFDLTVSTHELIPQQFAFHLISFGLLTSAAFIWSTMQSTPLKLNLHARWPAQVVFNRLSRGLQKPGCHDSELYTSSPAFCFAWTSHFVDPAPDAMFLLCTLGHLWWLVKLFLCRFISISDQPFVRSCNQYNFFGSTYSTRLFCWWELPSIRIFKNWSQSLLIWSQSPHCST